MKDRFVFCVVGGKKYIKELNFSIKFLKYFSKKEIIVITDLTRNEIDINHDNLINVKTPDYYNNHQAAIYLKTGIANFVDFSNYRYCYLDTDIFTVRGEIDSVFSHFSSPVTFCSDISTIHTFSRSTVYLPTISKKQSPELQQLLLKCTTKNQQKSTIELNKKFLRINESFWELKYKSSLLSSIISFQNIPQSIHYFYQFLKTFFSGKKIAIKFILQFFPYIFFKSLFILINLFNRFLKPTLLIWAQSELIFWKEKSGNTWLEMIGFKQYCLKKGYRYELKEEQWYNFNGKLLFQNNEFEHKLKEKNENCFYSKEKEQIYLSNNECIDIEDRGKGFALIVKEKFGTKITDFHFRQWNGGFFLFDKHAINFLNTWHEFTLAIFDDPNWKTRDQGTLIATVWKYGLQKHPRLPQKFNRLIDPNKSSVKYMGNFTFEILNEGVVEPINIHFHNGLGAPNNPIQKDLFGLHDTHIFKFKTENI